MFSPEMMQAAQKMMANMKPEDMQRMSQMAANMDPKVMENMVKNMGGQVPTGMDTAKAFEQMKNMSPQELQAGMTQAQSQLAAQKQYMYNAAEMLKNEGNTYVKAEKYSEALSKYSKALENISAHAGDDISSLKVVLLNNSALCYLKTKDFNKALESSGEALQVDPKSFKALFRRGQAKAEIGHLGEAVADVRRAAELSPGDKAIAAELERLRGQLKERGLQEDALPETHCVRAEWQQPPGDAATPSTSSGSRASSSSASSTTGGGVAGAGHPDAAGGGDRWAKAAEQLAENPDMLQQATEVMSKLSPDDLQRMVSSTPLPPGMDANTVRSQMEQIQKNPEMLKSAMESLQALPEEERKKMLAQRCAGAGGGSAPPGDAAWGRMFDDPEMIQRAVGMTKDMSEEDLKKLNIHSKEQADMMRQAAESMAADPNLAKQFSEMMKNMSPGQVQEMMDLSSKVRGGAGMPGMPAGTSSPAADMNPSAMMNDPDMLKATEQMMKNMSPETLASVARASGLDISEDKARMMAKFLPYLMRLMRWFSYCKRLWSFLWSRNGRLVLAGLVLVFAMLQHMRSSSSG
mmetsp:Transcript_114647/g.319264  ORF Transcript_114647/g.319264 Transcript_114647/m.319264 type:complete len:577 (+) Transcript_114647:197-1927(+)